MFDNCNPDTNGEVFFYNMIKKHLHTIFDVGCRYDTLFLDFSGEVHYFDPVQTFVDKLSKSKTNNSKSFYNAFGLGSEEKELFYYPAFQSFYDRVASVQTSDDANKIILKTRKASNYMIEKNIRCVDFLKIDTEGYEFEVIRGFGDLIKNVKIIQFEYGGTFIDNNTSLSTVINYLENAGFDGFSYLTPTGPQLITDFSDHYRYCNIVCSNNRSFQFPPW